LIQAFWDVTACVHLQDQAIPGAIHPKQVFTALFINVDIYSTVDTARQIRILETLSKPLGESKKN
jgi:hypothetical protein